MLERFSIWVNHCVIVILKATMTVTTTAASTDDKHSNNHQIRKCCAIPSEKNKCQNFPSTNETPLEF